jgi:hypothetical protein
LVRIDITVQKLWVVDRPRVIVKVLGTVDVRALFPSIDIGTLDGEQRCVNFRYVASVHRCFLDTLEIEQRPALEAFATAFDDEVHRNGDNDGAAEAGYENNSELIAGPIVRGRSQGLRRLEGKLFNVVEWIGYISRTGADGDAGSVALMVARRKRRGSQRKRECRGGVARVHE